MHRTTQLAGRRDHALAPPDRVARRRAMRLWLWFWPAALCSLLAWGEQPGPAARNLASLPQPREFATRGVVQRLDPGGRSVVIQHEAIPDFMPAMTMPFHVKATNELAGMKAGDAVSFRLLVTEEESWIDQVNRIRSAVAPPDAAPAVIPAAVETPPPQRHPLLDYAFTNELGQVVRLGQFRGRALAITFIFTRCPIPDYCPRLSKNFEEAIRKLSNLPGAPTNWHFLTVSFDPEFDTPAVLKAYGERYGYDPRHWSFLTGPKDRIGELARLSDVQFEPNGAFFNHNLRTLIIDPTGQLRMSFPIGGDLSDAIVGEILKATATTNQAYAGSTE
jgi:protein SCO1/2